MLAASFVPGDYSLSSTMTRQTMVELHTERSMRHFPVAPDLKDLRRQFSSRFTQRTRD